MTDYKQLCADLLAWAEKASSHYYTKPSVITRARAALAEPETEGPTRQELKTFACEWWRTFGYVKDKATCKWVIDNIDPEHFVDFMDDTLAKWGSHPGSPDSSTDLETRIENLEALVRELRVGYLRMANAVANQLPDRTKFFADLPSDSDD